jgi:hypothetical protein
MALALVLVLSVGACSNLFSPDGNDTATSDATVNFNLTDAPLDNPNVTGVFVNIQTIEYQLGGDEDDWQTVDSYDPSNPDNPYNLLELTNGRVKALGDFAIPSGSYDSMQIRLILEGPDEGGSGPPTNPGSFIDMDDDGEFTDGTDEPLFVPSGAQTGVKLNAPEFTVPENGEVTITADFDARRSVRVTGRGYLMRPTIRLIVDDQAGTISGSLAGLSADSEYTVLAYEDGAYVETEADDPAEGETRFPNAVSSADLTDADEDGTADEYTLPFLSAGSYDIYIAEYRNVDDDAELEYVGGASDGSTAGGQPITGPADVEVTAGEETSPNEFDVSGGTQDVSGGVQ